ncbi:MAG: hypothetical protein AAB666_00600 [Patescibacteria group bacterium]
MSFFQIDPDSPKALAKLVIGLFLLPFFGLALLGGWRLWFIAEQGQPTEPIIIDLTKDSVENIPNKGFLEISGYPRYEVSMDSGTGNLMTSEGWNTTRNFYFSLHQTAESNFAPVIVIRKYSLVGKLWNYFGDEKKIPPIIGGEKITVSGIAGYHGRDLPESVRQEFEANNLTVPLRVVVLDEYASVPSLAVTLIYFIPAMVLFLLGVYFLIHWIYFFWQAIRSIF